VTEVRGRAFDNPADAMVTGAQLQEGSAYNYGLVNNGELTVPEGGGATSNMAASSMNWAGNLQRKRDGGKILFALAYSPPKAGCHMNLTGISVQSSRSRKHNWIRTISLFKTRDIKIRIESGLFCLYAFI